MQENEDEKLSKEEQDMAWEVYQKTLEWEEIRRVSPDENIPEQYKILTQESIPVVERKLDPPTPVAPKPDHALERLRQRHQYRYGLRQCTNIAHLMTLKSQRIHKGGSAICGECAQFVRWEDIKL